jgi:hypothetical protein
MNTFFRGFFHASAVMGPAAKGIVLWERGKMREKSRLFCTRGQQ